MVAELVGVAEEDIAVKIARNQLSISANRRDRSYHEEVSLPAEVNVSKYTQSCRNGVLVVRLEKLQ